MCEVCSHYLAITSFMCDTLYYWSYWTKGGAVLHLQEFKTNSITLFVICKTQSILNLRLERNKEEICIR